MITPAGMSWKIQILNVWWPKHSNCFSFSSQLSFQVSFSENCLNTSLYGLINSSSLSPPPTLGSGSRKAQRSPRVCCSSPCSPGRQRHQAASFSQRGGNEITCLWWQFWLQFPGVSVSKRRTNNLTSMNVLFFLNECYKSWDIYLLRISKVSTGEMNSSWYPYS